MRRLGAMLSAETRLMRGVGWPLAAPFVFIAVVNRFSWQHHESLLRGFDGRFENHLAMLQKEFPFKKHVERNF
jgi:hypothetical protein